MVDKPVEKASAVVVTQVNKRIDNMENRVINQVSAIEHRVNNIETVLTRNTLILDQHMKRTELNEQSIKEFREAHFKSVIDFKSFQNRVLGGVAVAAFVIPIILSILNKVL